MSALQSARVSFRHTNEMFERSLMDKNVCVVERRIQDLSGNRKEIALLQSNKTSQAQHPGQSLLPHNGSLQGAGA